MLRAFVVMAVGTVLTLAMIPFQAIALLVKGRAQRRFPIFYPRLLCRLLGVRVRVSGSPLRGHPLLVVSNHTSWIDIPVIASVHRVVFVAKSEVASWPVIGLLARLQGTVFVERRRRHQTGEANAQIARHLAVGDAVVLFAEGTSSDGNRVLAFRSALVGAARDALAAVEHGGSVYIQPLSIAYVGFQGLPMGRQNRPLTAWYGDMDLFPHLLRVIRQGALDVRVTWGEPIVYAADADRKTIANALEATVRQLTAAALRMPLAS